MPLYTKELLVQRGREKSRRGEAAWGRSRQHSGKVFPRWFHTWPEAASTSIWSTRIVSTGPFWGFRGCTVESVVGVVIFFIPNLTQYYSCSVAMLHINCGSTFWTKDFQDSTQKFSQSRRVPHTYSAQGQAGFIWKVQGVNLLLFQ